MESRRQKKIASLIQKEIGEIFQREGANYYGQAFVTITEVWVSPDLSISKIYISVFNNDEPEAIAAEINRHVGDIRWRFGNRVRHQLRKIPHLEFLADGTLEKAFRINELLKD